MAQKRRFCKYPQHAHVLFFLQQSQLLRYSAVIVIFAGN